MTENRRTLSDFSAFAALFNPLAGEIFRCISASPTREIKQKVGNGFHLRRKKRNAPTISDESAALPANGEVSARKRYFFWRIDGNRAKVYIY